MPKRRSLAPGGEAASPLALVLGGGGARGAYEVGVAQFLFQDLVPRLGFVPRVDILCGTSAGAINACGLASFAPEPLHGVAALARRWMELDAEVLLKIERREALGLVRALLGCRGSFLTGHLRGGLLDAAPFLAAFGPAIDFSAIHEHIAAGRLRALSVTATEVATGRTTLFVHRRPERRGRPVARPGATVVEDVEHASEHLLASTAIPLLLPPVRIGGRLYCDGSLRQHVPLSPALRLGARRALVVTTQPAAASTSPLLSREREAAYPAPLFMLGKAVDALTLDRVDEDLDRLAQLNRVIEAGERAFGPEFLRRLNRRLGPGQALESVDSVVIRPSESLGRVAADFVRSADFRARGRGVVGRTLARLAEGETEHEGDFLSYLLFDGRFAAALTALGREDARACADDLARLLAPPARAQRAAG